MLSLSFSLSSWCHHEKRYSNSREKQPLKKKNKKQGSPFMLARSHCLFSGLPGQEGKETSRKYTNTTSRPPSSPPACRENTRRNLSPVETKPEPDLFTKPLLRLLPEPVRRGVWWGGEDGLGRAATRSKAANVYMMAIIIIIIIIFNIPRSCWRPHLSIHPTKHPSIHPTI